MVAMVLIILIFSTLVIIDFLKYIVTGSHLITGALFRITEFIVIILLPLIALSMEDIGQKNDCCSESAVFSPNHRTTIYFLIAICVLTYSYTSYRKTLATPIIEVVLSSILFMGIVLNIFIAIQFNEFFLWFFGNFPIIILFLYALIKTHQLWKISNKNNRSNYTTKVDVFCWQILNWKFFQKIPALLVICLPILLVAICVLMLFGQKPDSFILAFTDTYKHGLSQLDCTGVICPNGHFLCTIAASGHNKLVKPIRKGVRQGCIIKVNRQLLISNAFEDLIQEKLPYLHKPIRQAYNVVGGNFAQLYIILSNKWVSDMLFIIIKPMEWFFLIILYLCDKNPENRIAKQYLYAEHRTVVDITLKGVKM